ncbi:hypothetical protein Echvi_3467 [Echinicola vietnamensis DSM 17526]|uniref:Uncharacterized protein n=1 Tax=Echinicola vietnamensis (strain DSM 17526 / LMG 23754 / KMM 6221) TaxID=926556 RepID=L0G300_ECHVK|nr:hypothetical protein Echvi_3467 [Echinicola vietnamensis DSM 17526]
MSEPSVNWNRLYLLLILVLAGLIVLFYGITRYYS